MAGRQRLEEEYRERVMRAVEFIEANLGRPFPLEAAACEASWSFFHFHRVFQSIVGMPPGEYLRRRRLACAAQLFAKGRASVAEVAAETGFGSPEALVRSFKASFGTTPGEYRKRASTLALMNPFGPYERPIIRHSPFLACEPRVEPYGPVRLAGLRRAFTLEDPDLVHGISGFWDEALPALREAAGRAPGDELPESWEIAEANPASGGESILLLAGVGRGAGGKPLPPAMEEFVIPAGDYLLAIHRGPTASLNETYLYLYGDWLPRMGLRPGAPMDFAYYGREYVRGDPQSEASLVEFRIPLS